MVQSTNVIIIVGANVVVITYALNRLLEVKYLTTEDSIDTIIHSLFTMAKSR
jgi:hypothetical protein